MDRTPVLPVAMEDRAAVGCLTPLTGAEQLWDLPEERTLRLWLVEAVEVALVPLVEL